MPQKPNDFDAFPKLVAGYALLALGSTCVVGGAVLIVVGIMEEKEHQKITLNVGPGSFKFAYNF